MRRAQEQTLPIAVVNIGPTRADDIATVKVSASIGAILPRLALRLTGGSIDAVAGVVDIGDRDGAVHGDGGAVDDGARRVVWNQRDRVE